MDFDINGQPIKNELLANIAEAAAVANPQRAEEIAGKINLMDYRIQAVVSIAAIWLGS